MNKERCTFCGAALPQAAQFCGTCGRSLSTSREMPTSQPSLPGERDDASTSLGRAEHAERKWGFDFTQRTYNWEQGETTEALIETDEEDDEKAAFPLFGAGQPASSTPMVQGTPQWSGVPVVQRGSGAPSRQASLPNAASPTPQVAPFAPSVNPITPPLSWMSAGGAPLPPHPAPAVPRASRLSSKTAAAGKKPAPGRGSCGLVALIIAVICLILLGTIGGLFFGVPPTISIVGSSTVIVGSSLHVHGTHFLPGSGVTLILDEHIPLFTAEPQPLAAEQAALALSVTMASQETAPANTGLKADGAGNFDVSIPVSAAWGPGSHSIKATEAGTGRSYSQQFTVHSPTARLLTKPTLLDFGQLEVGSKAVLSVVINNGGGQVLNWQATTTGEPWLKLSLTGGSVPPALSPQYLYVTADVTHLKVGKYTATLTLTSNGGDAQINVRLEVIPATPLPQAKLHVTPTSLDFGTLDVGNQGTQVITIGNSGNLALNWKADVGNAGWVTLDRTAHSVAAGGQPDMVNVTVDTTNLAAGSQSAAVTITSNGGKVQVAITVVVNVPAPPSSPTPTPTLVPTVSPTSPPPPCTLQAPSPSSAAFSAYTGANPNSQSFTISVTGTCNSGVTIMATTAMASGTAWLAVASPSETATNGSAMFTINVTSAKLAAGSYSGTITLNAVDGNGNTLAGSPQTVNVTLTVKQGAVGSVSPTSLTYTVLTTDVVASQNVTIANTGGSALDWSATLQNAPAFVQQSANSGTKVTSSTPATDSISVDPSKASAGSYSATLLITMTDSVTGQALSGSPVTVTISITVTAPVTAVAISPTVTVSPTTSTSPSLQLSKSTVTFAPTTCSYPVTDTVTLTNTGGGTLSWTVGNPSYTTPGDPGGWLTVSPTQGSGDMTLTFSADGSVQGLMAGQTYTASVTITPSSGNAQTVKVSFTIPNCIQ